ncbi:cupin domain-containing protein [Nocardia caishijiensis]|uniref:Quercetin dioxygenase-like cupin family protein n=1 Tax=Nocardia caishijiensis TaxID=184756 RepID=A0ABQ6YJU1_9NOCA|nr:cupin domain-containing protein [Nocardia caishijiensis]KAF0846059.1 quercetin dioxygenase-like cupin family protein [Nocardia caishijiensis]
MPVVRSADAQVYEVHNARFAALIRPAVGSVDLCVWQTEIAPGSVGVAHRILGEEAFVLLAGDVVLTVDGDSTALRPGDAAVAPAGALIALTNETEAPARLLVTVRSGFAAELPDGSTFVPPWAS